MHKRRSQNNQVLDFFIIFFLFPRIDFQDLILFWSRQFVGLLLLWILKKLRKTSFGAAGNHSVLQPASTGQLLVAVRRLRMDWGRVRHMTLLSRHRTFCHSPAPPPPPPCTLCYTFYWASLWFIIWVKKTGMYYLPDVQLVWIPFSFSFLKWITDVFREDKNSPLCLTRRDDVFDKMIWTGITLVWKSILCKDTIRQ